MPQHTVYHAKSNKLKSIRNLLLQEIAWCDSNRGISGKGRKFEAGFLGGLGQAVYLVDQVIRLSKGLPPENPVDRV